MPRPLPPTVALGTAQWGMDYGIANRTGRPSGQEVDRILELARCSGVTTLDTARAYGDAEERLGEHLGGSSEFRIVTKVSPDVLGAGAGEAGGTQVRDRTLGSVEESLARLRRSRLDVVLLHRGDHVRAAGGAALAALQELRGSGTVGRVGVSATNVAEARWLVEVDGVEALQVPASLADRRLAGAGFFDRARERGVEVFVRSVLLQGVANLAAEALPEPLRALTPLHDKVWALSERRGVSPVALWLSYARLRLPATLVLGCETAPQFAASLAALERPALAEAELEELLMDLPTLPDEVLDPAKWWLPR